MLEVLTCLIYYRYTHIKGNYFPSRFSYF